mmetsp:Transcript_26663/g.40676  ORF Transcript_26663/g.40676 Transcript_26663/m.40676 type:complete len:88 (+) Transcript_26663:701-964(+)
MTFNKVPTLETLKVKARETFSLAADEEVDICKFITHEFEWKFIDPEEMIDEKVGKKKKQIQRVSMATMDLRKWPFFLQDGDIIGVRL